MTARIPIEFTDVNHRRVGNTIQLADENGVIISDDNPLSISTVAKDPGDFAYKYLRRVSGPAAATDIDMITNSSLGDPSVFEYEVPVAQQLELRRVNFEFIDGGMQNQRFAGLASALTNGCLFEIIDNDGNTQLLDFLDGPPITMNADFQPIAGVDSPLEATAGDDALPIRFTIGRAGATMLLVTGQRIRFTVRDNLSTVTRFRAMAQGIFEAI